MRWRIHDDGSFDLETPCGALRSAWPGLDHQAVRCARVEVAPAADGGELRYHLAGGAVLVLRLAAGDGTLELGCRLEGMAAAPHWVQPLHDARVEGFDRVFRQGQGFSGPSGFAPIARSRPRGQGAEAAAPAWNIGSHLLIGLGVAAGLVVAGPLDHRDWVWQAGLHNRQVRGSFRDREVQAEAVLAWMGFRCERVPLPDGGLTLPTIRFSHGADPFLALREHAGTVAAAYGIAVRPPTRHYCSWYHRTEHFALADLRELCDGLEIRDPQRGVGTVQIDDGYMVAHGDWLACKPDLWPGGLEPAFRAIAAAGRRPGVWVAPFMVGSSSRLAREHPEWLLRWADGSRVVEWRHWDGTRRDFEHYVLDTTHPDAFAWIRTVFRTLHAQGARFFKTDFLEWGFKDSTAVRRHRGGRSSMQVFRELMLAIREDIGPDSHWLGCITYFAPMLGLCDGMRVASDIGLDWNRPGGTGNDGTGGGTQNMVEETFATQYFNRVWWENDPDVVYLRDHHVLHEDGAWQALACWHGILGGSVNTSDEIHAYPPQRRAWWEFLRPGPPGIARLPWFACDHRFRVAVREVPGGWAALLLNDRAEAGFARCPLADLVGLPAAACWSWGPERAEPLGRLTEVAAELAGHRHLLVFISRDGSPPAAGLSLQGATAG